MNTRRERAERRLQRREEWAEKARARSEAAHSAVRATADGVPFGQPILVGHHSEARSRRDAARIHNGMERAVREAALAEHHDRKASNIEARLESTIFSDDPDALERLAEKIANLEAERDRRKLVNRLYRKGDAEGLSELGLTIEGLKADMKRFWADRPYPSYSLSNISANIRRLKQRVEAIRGGAAS